MFTRGHFLVAWFGLAWLPVVCEKNMLRIGGAGCGQQGRNDKQLSSISKH